MTKIDVTKNLKDADWNLVLEQTDVTLAYGHFEEIVRKILDSEAPMKFFKKGPIITTGSRTLQKLPWWPGTT